MPGASTSSATSNTTTTPAQLAQFQAGFQGLQGALSTANSNAAGTQPTGFTAQMTPQQLQAYQALYNNATGSGNAATEGSTGALASNAGAAGLQGALSGYAGYNPNIQGEVNAGNAYASGMNIPAQVQAAMRDANQEATDVTLPGIDSQAAGTNNTNSSRTGIQEGIVDRGLAQQAGDLSATLRNNAFATGAGLQNSNYSNILGGLNGFGATSTGALGAGTGALSSGVADTGATGAQALAGAGGAQQNQQLGFQNQNQAYSFGQNSPFMALQNYMNGLNVNAGGTSNGTSTQTPSFMQTIGSLLGAGGSALGSSGGAFGGASGILGMVSDRRVKQDIEQVGLLFDGTPVYRYRYIGNPVMQIGVMAQDVEEFAPEAVIELHGIKHVDYAKATERALGHAGVV
jgi:Chaperone of endosialidase